MIPRKADFSQLNWISALMSSFPRPWFFCGGWALDLFLGKVTRPLHDVEIGVFRQDQAATDQPWLFRLSPRPLR
jgi:hypothetical protein